MADENHRTVLLLNNAPGRSDIVGQRYRGILNDGDTVAALFQYFIDAFPTGTVYEATVDENDSNCRRTSYSSHDDLLSLMIATVVQIARQLREDPRCVSLVSMRQISAGSVGN